MSAFDAISGVNMPLSASFSPVNTGVLHQVFQDQRQQLQQLAGQNMGGQAMDMMKQSMERFHDFAFGESARKIEALRHKVGSVFETDRIRAITTIGKMQQAPDTMVQYIMCQPEVATLYEAGDINGYEGKFLDIQPGVHGEDHVLYRHMHSGMFMQRDCGEELGVRHTAKTYFDSYKPERRLNFHERCALIQTAQNIVSMVEEGVADPTSEWNDLM